MFRLTIEEVSVLSSQNREEEQDSQSGHLLSLVGCVDLSLLTAQNKVCENSSLVVLFFNE